MDCFFNTILFYGNLCSFKINKKKHDNNNPNLIFIAGGEKKNNPNETTVDEPKVEDGHQEEASKDEQDVTEQDQKQGTFIDFNSTLNGLFHFFPMRSWTNFSRGYQSIKNEAGISKGRIVQNEKETKFSHNLSVVLIEKVEFPRNRNFSQIFQGY